MLTVTWKCGYLLPHTWPVIVLERSGDEKGGSGFMCEFTCYKLLRHTVLMTQRCNAIHACGVVSSSNCDSTGCLKCHYLKTKLKQLFTPVPRYRRKRRLTAAGAGCGQSHWTVLPTAYKVSPVVQTPTNTATPCTNAASVPTPPPPSTISTDGPKDTSHGVLVEARFITPLFLISRFD
jgi:hypothetical protein